MANDARLPPGQVETKGWPVLHYGDVPHADPAKWTFRVFGLVDAPTEWPLHELTALAKADVRCDIHCVTRWSRFDNVFTGVPLREVLARVKPRPEAKFVIIHAEAGFTTNLPLADLDRDDVLLATHHDGQPLTPDHGGPLRLLVPHLYFWKSAKWLRGFEFTDRNRPGFWERNGYHMRGDPWGEERYSF
jgi:DMSO/TMAO reductase YedYZ molybdopterin-dependent catalytic subunit